MRETIEFEVTPEQVEQAMSDFLGGDETTFLGAEIDPTTGSIFFRLIAGSLDDGYDITQFATESIFFASMA